MINSILAGINQCELTSLETRQKNLHSGVVFYKDDKGRARLLYCPDNAAPIAAILLDSNSSKIWTIEQMITKTEHRRTGIMRSLVMVAKEHFKRVEISQSITSDGLAFCMSTGFVI